MGVNTLPVVWDIFDCIRLLIRLSISFGCHYNQLNQLCNVVMLPESHF